MTTTRLIQGSCHCGNIRFIFRLPAAAGPVPVRSCGCSFCRKHGGLYTSHPQGSLTVEIGDTDKVQRYRFGHRTADFHVCRTCGVVPLVTSRIDGNDYAVVSARSFDGLGPEDLAEQPTDFEGEEIDGRLARRARNWIPEVKFE